MNTTSLKPHRTTRTWQLSPHATGLLIATIRALTPYLLAACILFMFDPARACAGW